MSDYEREDMELAEMMGGQFIDATQGEETVTMSESKPEPVRKPTNDPTKVFQGCTEWEPVKERNWMDGLKACAKWAVVFGGLNMLIFYWQMAGLMAESIAVPSMWVCCALAGYGVGRNVWRWSK